MNIVSLTLNACVHLIYFSIVDLLQVMEKIESGYRLPPPPGCPRSIYRMMVKCWYVCDLQLKQM